MKTTIFRLTLVVFAVALAAFLLQQPFGYASAGGESTTTLTPEARHMTVSQLTSQFMTRFHYRKPQIDEALSQRVFEQYLTTLDPNRIYFTAADVEGFSKYEDTLAKAVKDARLAPAYEIFDRYLTRSDERIEYALGLLDGGFDFEVDESYRFDRREEPWAEDRDELNELWRQRVKNEWLQLKLADKDSDEIAEKLTERYENLQRRMHEFNSDDVFSLFMNAFSQSIEPHSTYMSPRSSENFEISMRLSLEGIGALLQRDSEYTTIVEVIPGGPADLDGRLQPKDRVVGVGQGEDGEITDVIGWRLDDVVEKIRGERGTVVRLEVLPAETGLGGPSEIIKLERNEVKLEEQAASSDVIELPGDGDSDDVRRIGVISVPVFYVDFEGRTRNQPDYRSSTRDVRKLISELKKEDVDALVIDLRGNGGGALVEATTMTGLFIDTGPVVQVRDSHGKIDLKSDNEPGMAWDGPLGVLVDRHSASASEIFAGAIQDYGRGVIIGEPTFGKGTVQNLVDLDNFSSSRSDKLGQLRVTMAQFYRVIGDSTQNKGVIPDIRLPTPGDSDEYGESALDYAMPWAQIDAVEFEPMADLAPLIEQARSRHELRLQTDEELAELIEEIDEWEAEEDHGVLSLLESVRREKMEKAEARRKRKLGRSNELALEAGEQPEDPAVADEEEEEEDDGPDLFLKESARIMADLIALDRKQLLAHHLKD